MRQQQPRTAPLIAIGFIGRIVVQQIVLAHLVAIYPNKRPLLLGGIGLNTHDVTANRIFQRVINAASRLRSMSRKIVISASIKLDLPVPFWPIKA